jgi:L-arabinose isomerase
MIDLKQDEVWFVTGSQHLYGPKTLEIVADHSCEIATAFSASEQILVQVIFKPVLTTPEAILLNSHLLREFNFEEMVNR